MSKKAKKNCIPKREAFKVMRMCRDCIADINDLAFNVSQIWKFVEKYGENREFLDYVQKEANRFGESYDSDDVVTIARVCYSAIDGFMSTVGNSTDLTKITKRTTLSEAAEVVSNALDDEAREELILAIKDWAEKWYAQHEEEIEEIK